MLKLELDEAEDAATTGSPEERGRAVFAANCRLCHGADLTGQPPGRSIVGRYRIEAHRSEEIRAIVKQGNGPMPAFARLSDATLDSLLAYLSNPGRAPAPAATESAKKPAELP